MWRFCPEVAILLTRFTDEDNRPQLESNVLSMSLRKRFWSLISSPISSVNCNPKWVDVTDNDMESVKTYRLKSSHFIPEAINHLVVLGLHLIPTRLTIRSVGIAWGVKCLWDCIQIAFIYHRIDVLSVCLPFNALIIEFKSIDWLNGWCFQREWRLRQFSTTFAKHMFISFIYSVIYNNKQYFCASFRANHPLWGKRLRNDSPYETLTPYKRTSYKTRKYSLNTNVV